MFLFQNPQKKKYLNKSCILQQHNVSRQCSSHLTSSHVRHVVITDYSKCNRTGFGWPPTEWNKVHTNFRTNQLSGSKVEIEIHTNMYGKHGDCIITFLFRKWKCYLETLATTLTDKQNVLVPTRPTQLRPTGDWFVHNTKTTNSVISVRKRTIPTARPPHVGGFVHILK
jgi:hypothetical protein